MSQENRNPEDFWDRHPVIDAIGIFFDKRPVLVFIGVVLVFGLVGLFFDLVFDTRIGW
jgi:hypothetical protein